MNENLHAFNRKIHKLGIFLFFLFIIPVIIIELQQHLTTPQAGLKKTVLGAETLTDEPATTITFPPNAITVDNTINITDYNALLDCYSTDSQPTPRDPNCTDASTKKVKVDLNDDGDVNFYDLNLFIREVLTTHGD